MFDPCEVSPITSWNAMLSAERRLASDLAAQSTALVKKSQKQAPSPKCFASHQFSWSNWLCKDNPKPSQVAQVMMFAKKTNFFGGRGAAVTLTSHMHVPFVGW